MLEIIRNMEDLEDLKITFYSSRVEKDIVMHVLKYNVLDYFHKGSDQNTIIARLNKHFKKFNLDKIKKI